MGLMQTVFTPKKIFFPKLIISSFDPYTVRTKNLMPHRLYGQKVNVFTEEKKFFTQVKMVIIRPIYVVRGSSIVLQTVYQGGLMHRHAASHGLAVLISTICAALLIDMARNSLPDINSILARFSDLLIRVLVELGIQVPFSPGFMAQTILASLLAVILGVTFGAIRAKVRS